MIAVIFAAFPAEGQWEEYLDLATMLKPELIQREVFIALERFQSLSNPRKVLSPSFWKDESNITRWQNLALHRQVQAKGGSSFFTDYRLRVAAVMRDYGMSQEAPEGSLDTPNH